MSWLTDKTQQGDSGIGEGIGKIADISGITPPGLGTLLGLGGDKLYNVLTNPNPSGPVNSGIGSISNPTVGPDGSISGGLFGGGNSGISPNGFNMTPGGIGFGGSGFTTPGGNSFPVGTPNLSPSGGISGGIFNNGSQGSFGGLLSGLFGSGSGAGTSGAGNTMSGNNPLVYSGAGGLPQGPIIGGIGGGGIGGGGGSGSGGATPPGTGGNGSGGLLSWNSQPVGGYFLNQASRSNVINVGNTAAEKLKQLAAVRAP